MLTEHNMATLLKTGSKSLLQTAAVPAHFVSAERDLRVLKKRSLYNRSRDTEVEGASQKFDYSGVHRLAHVWLDVFPKTKKN